VLGASHEVPHCALLVCFAEVERSHFERGTYGEAGWIRLARVDLRNRDQVGSVMPEVPSKWPQLFELRPIFFPLGLRSTRHGLTTLIPIADTGKETQAGDEQGRSGERGTGFDARKTSPRPASLVHSRPMPPFRVVFNFIGRHHSACGHASSYSTQ
jgi:hypothetical protein